MKNEKQRQKKSEVFLLVSFVILVAIYIFILELL